MAIVLSLVAAAVIAAVVVPGLLGLRISPDFESAHDVLVPRAREDVWATVSGVATLPMFGRGRRPPEIVAGAPVRTWREFPAGTGTSMLLEAVEESEPERIVVAFRDEIAPVRGRLELRIVETAPGESRVRAIETMHVGGGGLRGPYFRFALRAFGPGAGSRAYLRALREALARR
jgi:hypothetical protein